MLTIKVRFPTGEREVPAYYQQEDMIRAVGGDRDWPKPWFAHIVPESMEGWDFKQMVSGEWHAFRTRRG